MIGLIALTIAAGQVPVAEDDILVIGRRLAQLAVIVGRDARGRFTCGLSQSSGNAALDRQLCRTAAKCVKSGAGDQAAAQVCIETRKPALLADVRRTLDRAATR